MREEHRGEGIYPHRELGVSFIVVFPKIGAGDHTRIVDEHINSAEFSDDLCHCFLDGSPVCQVQHQGHDLLSRSGRGAQSIRRLGQSLFVVVDEDDRRSALGYRAFGIEPTHAHRGTGNENAGINDSEAHALIVRPRSQKLRRVTH